MFILQIEGPEIDGLEIGGIPIAGECGPGTFFLDAEAARQLLDGAMAEAKSGVGSIFDLFGLGDLPARPPERDATKDSTLGFAVVGKVFWVPQAGFAALEAAVRDAAEGKNSSFRMGGRIVSVREEPEPPNRHRRRRGAGVRSECSTTRRAGRRGHENGRAGNSAACTPPWNRGHDAGTCSRNLGGERVRSGHSQTAGPAVALRSLEPACVPQPLSLGDRDCGPRLPVSPIWATRAGAGAVVSVAARMPSRGAPVVAWSPDCEPHHRLAPCSPVWLGVGSPAVGATKIVAPRDYSGNTKLSWGAGSSLFARELQEIEEGT
jgi:hypothetical protein